MNMLDHGQPSRAATRLRPSTTDGRLGLRLLLTVACATVVGLGCGGPDAGASTGGNESVKAFERDLAQPTGTVDAEAAKAVFAANSEVTATDGPLTSLQSLQSAGVAPSNCGMTAGAGTVDVSCFGNGMTGKMVYDIQQADQVTNMHMEYVHVCTATPSVCMDGSVSMQMKVASSGAGSDSRGSMETTMTYDVEVHRDSATQRVQAGMRMTMDDSGIHMTTVVHDTAGKSYTLSMASGLVTSADATWTLTGANGTWTCKVEGQSGQCESEGKGGTFTF